MPVGFYGKLPSHGDFVRRRVSDAFVDAWDGWLRECLPASRTALGSRWLDIYLTSPAWRFVCAAGACGPAPVIGLMAPSVDQVGRYFPLTLVAELSPDVSLITVAGWEQFFANAERLVIETLATERVDFERFDAGVMSLGQELAAIPRPPALAVEEEAAAILTDTPQAWKLPLTASHDVALAFEQLLSTHLEAKYRPLVIWWTDGSAVVEPSCLVHKGLPDPTLYPAFLDGSWATSRWRSPVKVVPSSTTLSLCPEDAGGGLVFRSAAATDVGRVRHNNQDAFLERPDAGLWAVADGMGGHSRGDLASRMVCDALADFPLDGTFDEAIDAATRRVQEVNDFLVRRAEEAGNNERMGSTVVVLLMRGTRAAVLWAGDTRVYRWRDGELERLTRDHSLAELAGTAARESSAITKAVGAESNLTLDVRRDGIRPGDRFLLCSDGLTRIVEDTDIRAWIAHPEIDAAVKGLIQATLDAGAPDNVTVLITDVRREMV